MIARFLALALLLLIGPAGAQTYNPWSAQLIAPRGVDGNLIGFSTTSATIGAGTFTFNVQPNGQFFPIQGQLLITSLVSPQNKMLGQIVAYCDPAVSSGCGVSVPHSIVKVQVTANEVFGSGTFQAWQLYLTPRPQSRIPLFASIGLQAAQVGTSAKITVNAGCARDVTDTVDICLAAAATIDFTAATNLVQVAQSGTVSSSGSTVTGASTTFKADFCSPAGCFFTDYNNQITAISQGSTQVFVPVIATAAQSASVTAIASDTSLSSVPNLSAGAGTAFFRGGPVNTNITSAPIYFGVYIALNPTTSATGIYYGSTTPSGTPDLPSGYTYYRVVGIASMLYSSSSGHWAVFVSQPLVQNPMAQNGDTFYYVAGQGAQNTFNTRLPIGAQNSLLSVSSAGLPFWAPLLTQATNVLSGDVNLSNTGTYFDGPSMAQGTSGTWWVIGGVTVADTAGVAGIECKLWDGTTVIDSRKTVTVGANDSSPISLGGYLASPAANIKISCKDITSTHGVIQFNASGNSADSTISGVRINFLDHPIPANDNDLIEKAVA